MCVCACILFVFVSEGMAVKPCVSGMQACYVCMGRVQLAGPSFVPLCYSTEAITLTVCVS